MTAQVGTNDMGGVSGVPPRQPPACSTNRPWTALHSGVLTALQSGTASRPCTPEHRRAAERRHNFPPPPAILNQQPFDVSILFCKEKKEEKKTIISLAGKLIKRTLSLHFTSDKLCAVSCPKLLKIQKKKKLKARLTEWICSTANIAIISRFSCSVLTQWCAAAYNCKSSFAHTEKKKKNLKFLVSIRQQY